MDADMVGANIASTPQVWGICYTQIKVVCITKPLHLILSSLICNAAFAEQVLKDKSCMTNIFLLLLALSGEAEI